MLMRVHMLHIIDCIQTGPSLLQIIFYKTLLKISAADIEVTIPGTTTMPVE